MGQKWIFDIIPQWTKAAKDDFLSLSLDSALRMKINVRLETDIHTHTRKSCRVKSVLGML